MDEKSPAWTAEIEEATAVAAAWWPAPPAVERLQSGLINRTFLVVHGEGRAILQRLHPIFGAEVHDDIEAVTAHLAARGVTTPRLIRTRSGALFTQGADGGVWRVLTYIDGVTSDRLGGDTRRAEAAGRLVGTFHGALADLEHEFRFRRAGVHDTERHLTTLHQAVAAHPGHARHAGTAALAERIQAGVDRLPSLAAAAVPLRVVHGDLKISNLMFDRHGDGLCLLDLDTLAHMKLPLELGDAWRSWCNPLGEDVEATRFELPLLEAAWRGYHGRAATWLTSDERTLLVSGILTVALELSARFAADTLNDSYFGWNAARFASRSEHNWVRAVGQFHLYESLLAQRAAAERIVSG